MAWHGTWRIRLDCRVAAAAAIMSSCSMFYRIYVCGQFLWNHAITVRQCERNEELCESWWSKRLSVAHFNTQEIKKNEHTLKAIKTELNLNWMREYARSRCNYVDQASARLFVMMWIFLYLPYNAIAAAAQHKTARHNKSKSIFEIVYSILYLIWFMRCRNCDMCVRQIYDPLQRTLVMIFRLFMIFIGHAFEMSV